MRCCIILLNEDRCVLVTVRPFVLNSKDYIIDQVISAHRSSTFDRPQLYCPPISVVACSLCLGLTTNGQMPSFPSNVISPSNCSEVWPQLLETLPSQCYEYCAQFDLVLLLQAVRSSYSSLGSCHTIYHRCGPYFSLA